MAKYYTKVMEKLDGAGDGFIESEIERIGRMLGTIRWQFIQFIQYQNGDNFLQIYNNYNNFISSNLQLYTIVLTYILKIYLIIK